MCQGVAGDSLVLCDISSTFLYRAILVSAHIMDKWQRTLCGTGSAVTRIAADFDERYIESVLGKIDVIQGIKPIQTLMPRPSLGGGPSYSDNFGFGAFPFHTDMAHWSIPPRYFALICVSGSSSVTTNIIHRDHLLSSREQVESARAILRPRRPLEGRQIPLRMLSGDIFRWDELFLEPVSRTATRIANLISDRLCNAKPIKVALEEPGQTLIVDNWRTLHGRSAVPQDSDSRVIKRIYLKSLAR